MGGDRDVYSSMRFAATVLLVAVALGMCGCGPKGRRIIRQAPTSPDGDRDAGAAPPAWDAPPSSGGASGGDVGSGGGGAGGPAGGAGGAGLDAGAGGTSGRGGAAGAGGGGAAGTGGRGGAGGMGGTGGAGGSGGGGGGGRGGGGGSGGSGGRADAGARSPDAAAAADAGSGGASVVDRLLALTATCRRVISRRNYEVGTGERRPICGLEGAVHFRAGLDINCNGRRTPGKCDATTAPFADPETLVGNAADQSLAAAVTPFVTVPGDFFLQDMPPGSVAIAIFQRKMIYAIFGDITFDDFLGEASYAAAERLGINPDPRSGGTDDGVTYIIFRGPGTVPRNVEDQAATQALGEILVQKLLLTNP
jgi:hypothetical protein